MIFEQAERVAQVRRLAKGAMILHFQDNGETVVCLNMDGKLDTSRARRLSRGAAHRLVNAMNTTTEMKKNYHQLIDEA